MAETPDRTESIFAAAVALPNSAERAALLERECADDPTLRGRIEALLRAHDRAGHLLDRPIPGGLEQTKAHFPHDQPGAVIAGRYKLLEAIGEGGMGAVWVAEQTEPVRRKVALKLIKAGMDSKSVLARFEAERQALAVMDHPNIAKVLDGGLTDAGRPFFVMDYVKGVPITEYCDATRLSVAERLNLFVQVCHAVQHAHQKGIIHRDLKPSNILVAPYDDKPVPKVIDFGLAKAMHQALTERTLHTAHETVLGTPLYMSPEQAQLNNLDVDTRSDIYSLGVLLYELLTGTTPLEKQRFKEAAWDEVKRIIREEEPPRPSMRLSSTATLPSLAAGRQIEPARLTKQVRGELDWIVMKSLEKDRSRRYETANGFATDVQRYLAGEPVLAAPPSARYRLRKFARKHRAVLTTATAITLLLVTGVALSTWQAVRATRAETAARLAEQHALASQRAESERAEGERLAKLDAEAKQAEAERQKVRAEAGEKLASERLVQVDAEKQKAVAEKQIAQAVLDFLHNKLLRQADVRNQADTLLRTGGVAAVTEAEEDPTIRELLDRAGGELTPDRIEANFPKQPLVQAGILRTVGDTYLGVGEYERAISFLERSVAMSREHYGPDDSHTLSTMNNLANAYQGAGKLDLAVPLSEETLKLRKAAFGPDDPGTLTCMNNLAVAYKAAGKLDLAVPLFEETLKLRTAALGPDHPGTLTVRSNLAGAYQAAGKLDLALPLYEETLKLQKAQLGHDHPGTLTGMNNLAVAYGAAGKLGLALPLYEETLKLRKAKLGADHPDTLITMNNLATAYQVAKMPDLAAALHEETLRLRKAKLGADHSNTLTSMNRLAVAYQAARKVDLALPLYEEALKLVEAKLGPEHPDTLTSMNRLAGAYQAARKLDLAVPLYEELLKLRKAKLGPEHPDTLDTMSALALAYSGGSGWNGGFSFDRAIPLWEELWKIRKQNLPEGNTTRIDTQARLGLNLLSAGRFAEAEPHLLASFRDSRSAKGFPKNWREAYALRLIGLYVEWDKPAEVAQWQAELNNLGGPTETWLPTTSVQMLEASRFRAAELMLRDCLAQREQAMPDSWRNFEAKSLLGGALLGQKKYADAEPLLLAGYAGMKQREKTVPQDARFRLTETVAWLVQVYEALDQKDEAAKWSQDAGKVSLSRYEDIVKILQTKLGPDHPDTIDLMSSLAWDYRNRGDFDHAVPSFEQLWKKRKQSLPEGSTARIDTQHQLGLTLVFVGRFAEAEPHLLASYRDGVSAKDFPKEWPQAYALRLVSLYTEWGKAAEVAKWQAEFDNFDDPTENWQSDIGLQMLQASRFQAAELLLRDCLAFREKTQPDYWTTFNTKSMLGGALLGQKKVAAAEPLLLAGYEGMKQREKMMKTLISKVRLTEAVERLVELYTATDKPDEVKKWQAERSKYPPPAALAPENQ